MSWGTETRFGSNPPVTLTALGWLSCLCAVALLSASANAQAKDSSADAASTRPEHGSLSEIGASLANPISCIWALSFDFQGPQFFDGNVNTGAPEVGGNMVFQPIMPFPIFGTGVDQWKVVTRPVIPIIFSEPSPEGLNDFEHRGGLGDIQIPLLFNPSERITGPGLILAAGPVVELPTATNSALGSEQYAVGPAAVVGYKNEFLTAVLFPNYFFGVGDRNDRKTTTPTTSKLALFYGLTFNLPDAWQIGLNATITYNDKASSGNRWNVPAGAFAARTIRIGRVPVNIKLGLEYSVVSQDGFGRRAQFSLQVTPVITGLVKKPIFRRR